MRFSKKALLLLALTVGILAAVSVPVMAAPYLEDVRDFRYQEADTGGNATDIDSGIVNGRAGVYTDSSKPGTLFVGYYRTNGTRTSAQQRGTQDTTPTQDTVLGVPAAKMMIFRIKDADSASRQGQWGGFVGWAIDDPSGAAVQAYKGETYPRRVPPQTGDTKALEDSVPWILIELEDTGVATIGVINTSNYPCSITIMLHMPDTDFRVHRVPAGIYREKAGAQIGKFITSIAGDSILQGVGGGRGEITADTQVPWYDTIPQRTINATLAEDAETYIYLRIAAGPTAFARDTLPITLVLFPDTGPDTFLGNARRNKVRVYHDTGYMGDNDSYYASGGSEDSVSVFVLVATAVVRAKKTDSIFAPASYLSSLGISNRYGSNRSSDTVPGARIVYTLTYDNDGNRRADSVTLIDYLPDNVDLSIDSYYNGMDTYYANGIGVDTRMGHARWLWDGGLTAGAHDRWAIVEFASRIGADSMIWNSQTSPFTGFAAKSDSVVDTVQAIKITWPTSFDTPFALQRDQVDDEYGTGSSDNDPLFTVDQCNINMTDPTATDSGDCGRIIFAVVIR